MGDSDKELEQKVKELEEQGKELQEQENKIRIAKKEVEEQLRRAKRGKWWLSAVKDCLDCITEFAHFPRVDTDAWVRVEDLSL